MSAGGFKFLVVADGSPESSAALHYAGLRAKLTGGKLVLLSAVQPSQFTHWVTVSEEMREEALAEAQARNDRHAAEVWAECGVEADSLILEHDVKTAVKRALEADPEIKVVVLAASPGREGPGPLVSSLSKSGGLGGRPVPVVVLPAQLTREQIVALAAPGGAA